LGKGRRLFGGMPQSSILGGSRSDLLEVKRPTGLLWPNG
jgi:hypothetical protein